MIFLLYIFIMTNVIKNKKTVKVKAPIVDALKQAYENPTYQFHIPGHTKGNGSLPEFKKLVLSTQPMSLTTLERFTLLQDL